MPEPWLIEIDDPDDPRLTAFRVNERGLASRADRRDDDGAGFFLAEGDLVVERAFDAGCTPVSALVDVARVPPLAGRLGIDVYAGGDNVREFVTRLGMPQSIVALFQRPARPTVADLAGHSRRLVFAEAVDNPANIGSIVRNAAALGWDGLVIDHTSADPLARRALRVAMGTTFALPHARTAHFVTALRIVHDAGFRVAALTPSPDAVDLDDVAHGLGGRLDGTDERVAIVVGSERAGLSDEVLAVADIKAKIPMSAGVDSLNAAAATAIACYALRQQG